MGNATRPYSLAGARIVNRQDNRVLTQPRHQIVGMSPCEKRRAYGAVLPMEAEVGPNARFYASFFGAAIGIAILITIVIGSFPR